MPVIAPWLKAPDIAEDYLRGAQVGNAIASERARLRQENVRMQMEAQIRQQELQRQTLLEQARLKTEQAYRQSSLGLQEARLRQAQEANNVRVQQAARKAVAQQRLAHLLDNGTPLDKALLQVPELATPKDIMDARKMAEDLSAQRLAERKLEDEERQRRYEEGRPVEVGETEETDTDPKDPNKKIVKRTKTYGRIGESGMGDGSIPIPPPSTGTDSSGASPAKIRVKSPDGKVGTVPSDKLQTFLDNGYTKVDAGN